MDPKRQLYRGDGEHRVAEMLQRDIAERRGPQQEGMNRAAESVLLGDDSIDFQEYKRRRAALPNLVIDPDERLDRCSMRDYKLRRAAQGTEQAVPAPGEKSLFEFLDGKPRDG